MIGVRRMRALVSFSFVLWVEIWPCLEDPIEFVYSIRSFDNIE